MSPPREEAMLDLLVAHATGTISEDEQARLDSMRAELDPGELESFEQAAAACALAMIAPEPMPAGLRGRCAQSMVRTMQEQTQTSEGTPSPPEPPAAPPSEAPPRPIRFTPPETPGRSGSGATRGWLVAAAVGLIAVIGWWRPGPTGVQPSMIDARNALLLQGGQKCEWSPWGEDASLAQVGGWVVWDSARQEGYMTFEGLEPNNPQQMRYQLWIVDLERGEALAVPPIDGGLFDMPESDGEVIVPIRAAIPVGKAAAFAVTREAPEGAVVSERRPDQLVVIASLG